MSTKLTDTQLLMLGAAAQRKDRCVAAPPNLKGAAAQKFAADLVDAGLAKEVKARPGAHIWRCDDVTRQAYALKLTPAGLKTIRVEETEVLGTAIETSPTPAGEGPRKTKVHDSRAGSVAPPGTIAAPREGSKLAKTRGRRYNRSTSRRDGLASPYHPRCVDRLAKTRVRDRSAQAKRSARGRYVIVNSQTATKG
jgi:hypothetical protein